MRLSRRFRCLSFCLGISVPFASPTRPSNTGKSIRYKDLSVAILSDECELETATFGRISALKFNQFASVVSLSLLAACAGRAPTPVAVVQPQDRFADCTAVMAEVNSNTQKISDLGKEDGAKVAQNVVAGVAGAFFIVPWLLMDFQNAAGKEGTALQQRNAYLATLAESRCNGTVVAGAAPTGVAVGPAAAAVPVVPPAPVAASAPSFTATRAERGPPTY
jgi:hypothetical protein